ncbi:FKBP-type peptidyl-prolyl cis-trans isomerase [Phenylobacterium sp.]|uniref:FKBP-type peptidyl-prolyl cis-trans isomerase n=1 Tax=Phenylobacterium sp. TaxID=1871053 RepID=UPI002734FD5D|nr:FKBP-type peptidyl-prolyl cis-trans isomerase [Phenylobacterium sp.]MDP3661139.1 FKBP-type peptidyl-prolyl cis-trans isomerase [Phenylobacterium sp.]
MALRFASLLACLLLAACGAPKAPDQSAASEAFLAQNSKAAGVVTLPSGLQYRVVRQGPSTGLHPQRADEVKVHYEGKLVSGKVFDSSYERGAPTAMPLGGLIPGWIEALQRMRPGDEWILYVPPELGYGDEQKGDIPPGSVMIFRIELIDVLPAPGRIQQG